MIPPMDLTAFAQNPLVGLLAFVGGAGLVFRLGRGLLRLALRQAEKATAEGLIEVSIRNGDITGMAERRAHAAAVRRARARDGLLAGLWAALLVVPAVAGVSGLVYPLAAVVWFLPRKPLRLTSGAAPPGPGAPEESIDRDAGDRVE